MRLFPVSRADDYDFPADTFDVRGWDVRTALDREKVGTVDDVLVDDAGRPRYLDVKLGVFKKHVLVPLAQARVDGQDDVIWVDGLARDQLEHIPEYTHDPRVVSAEYERRLGEIYRDASLTHEATTTTSLAEAEELPPARRLARLSELGEYRVAKGDTDPRGWDVVSGDGQHVGKVTELIVDVKTLEARYLDTDVDEKKLDLERVDRHILVPVDAARLDRGKKNVVLDGIFAKDVGGVPVYSGLPLVSDTEEQIRAAYHSGSRRVAPSEPLRVDAPAPAAPVIDDTRYIDRFYGARRGQRHIEQDSLDVREGESTTLSNGEQEVRIRLSGDDIIIEKRPLG